MNNETNSTQLYDIKELLEAAKTLWTIPAHLTPALRTFFILQTTGEELLKHIYYTSKYGPSLYHNGTNYAIVTMGFLRLEHISKAGKYLISVRTCNNPEFNYAMIRNFGKKVALPPSVGNLV